MKIPFLDIKGQNLALRDEINAAIQEVIGSGAFAGGPYVEQFEDDFAAYCGAASAVGVGNGTDALWLVLLALNVGLGDEVITVPSTFMATAEAISHCGARPVFVDIDQRTYTMDPDMLESAITVKTKAIIPVHLFGAPVDMDPIMDVARRYGLPVIEDAAQAHGASYKGRRVGGIGTAGCFSFYPGKNLGAFGEAGAVVTNDIALRDKIRALRDHGQVRKYHHTMVGWNCRMDGIQGAVLRVKLRNLDRANAMRRALAVQYDRALDNCDGVVTPINPPWIQHVYHIYAIRVNERDLLVRRLAEAGIGTGIHYPTPVHLQPAYEGLGYRRASFPVAEQCADEFVSLPMFPELPPDAVNVVASAVIDAVGSSARGALSMRCAPILTSG